MYGSNLAKVARLVGDLLRNPKYVVGYVSTNLLREAPLDLELPWFSYAAIDFLADFIQPHMCVFEYGTGGSTLFFARRARAVTCTEDNLAWLRKVKNHLDRVGLANVSLQHRIF